MKREWAEEFFTVMEVAELLKLNPQTVRNWIDEGRLPAVRIGRRIRVRRSELDRVLREGATSPVAVEAAIVGSASALDELADAIMRSRRVLDRGSVGRGELTEALRGLVEAAAVAIDGSSVDQRGAVDGRDGAG